MALKKPLQVNSAGVIRQQSSADQLEIATNVMEMCGGRLTLAQGDPAPTSAQTAKTLVYWTPYKSGGIGLWDGNRWLLKSFNESSISVPGTTNTNFDVFAFLANDSGLTFTLETVNWTNDTTRATALSFQDGILCKSGDKTRRYLGTCRTTGVNGQTEDTQQKRFVYNFHHKLNRTIKKVVTDISEWTYNVTAFRVANNDQNNKIECVIGYPDVLVSIQADSVNSHPGTTPQIDRNSGIGFDVYDGNFGTTGPRYSAMNGELSFCSSYLYHNPTVGYHFYAWLEFTNAHASIPTEFKAPGSGIHGHILM